MAKELTWRKAIEKVLSEASGAVHYKDLTERIIADGLRSNLGATPASTVSAFLTGGMKNEGDACPWQKIGRGLYIWKQKAGITQQPVVAEGGDEEEEQYEIISSFGMFWQRDAVEWVSTPKLLGMQQIGAEAVDFNKQIGIYLLYDGREIIYVGRATDRPLGRRLYNTHWTAFHPDGIVSLGLVFFPFQRLEIWVKCQTPISQRISYQQLKPS